MMFFFQRAYVFNLVFIPWKGRGVSEWNSDVLFGLDLCSRFVVRICSSTMLDFAQRSEQIPQDKGPYADGIFLSYRDIYWMEGDKIYEVSGLTCLDQQATAHLPTSLGFTEETWPKEGIRAVIGNRIFAPGNPDHPIHGISKWKYELYGNIEGENEVDGLPNGTASTGQDMGVDG